MPQIKVDVESFASNSLESEILDAVNAATPAGIEPSADVVRDSQGKLVQVNVNLPSDIAMADLETAKNAVQNNNGVSKAIAFPVDSTEDNFDALTPGNVLAPADNTIQPYSLGDITAALKGFSGSSASLIRAAQAADSFGGAGSALEYADGDIVTSKTVHQYIAQMRINAIDNGLTKIGSYKITCKMKLKDQSLVTGMGAGDKTFNSFTFGFVSLSTSQFTNGVDKASRTLWLNPGGSLGDMVDTGIDPVAAYVDVEAGQRADGETYIIVNGQEAKYNVGFVRLFNILLMNGSSNDTLAAAGSGEASSWLIDNLQVQILSGQ